jgi:hypothetical protein
MMIDEVQKLIDQYQYWLRDRTILRQVDDWVEITTPYLDRHNDYLQIYAKKENGDYLLTDDGWILEDLIQSGCSLDSPKRQTLLKMTLNGFGVQVKNGKLEVHASPDNFALRKHNLVQAMLSVNDLFYLAAPIVANVFYEDVVTWLDLQDIRFTPKVKFTGKSGYDHLFDFVIPKSRKSPERVIQAINHATKETAQSLAFSWIDTKDVRPPDSRAYAFLNDSESNVPVSVISAIRSYDVLPVLWSKRDTAREALAA